MSINKDDQENIFEYWIDSEDIIYRVSTNWDQFAIENDARDLLAENVLGRSLWDYVTESEIRQIYMLLFNRIRQKKVPLEFPYRCDSPHVKRFMTMKVYPLDNDSIKFVSRIDKIEKQREAKILTRDLKRDLEFIRMCSWCKKISRNGDWLEIEEAFGNHGIMADIGFPQITHTICQDCFERVVNDGKLDVTNDDVLSD
jgi:hypothetical protein